MFFAFRATWFPGRTSALRPTFWQQGVAIKCSEIILCHPTETGSFPGYVAYHVRSYPILSYPIISYHHAMCCSTIFIILFVSFFYHGTNRSSRNETSFAKLHKLRQELASPGSNQTEAKVELRASLMRLQIGSASPAVPAPANKELYQQVGMETIKTTKRIEI